MAKDRENKGSGSAKSTRSSHGSNQRQTSSSAKNTGSIKTLYRNSDGSSKSSGSSSSKNKKSGSSSKKESPSSALRNTASIKTLYKSSGDNSSHNRTSDNSRGVRTAESPERQLSSTKSVYGHGQAGGGSASDTKARGNDLRSRMREYAKEKHYISLEEEKEKDEEEENDKVNMFQLLYGIGEQGANMVVGNVANALDTFIGKPYQKAVDYAEKKLNLPDMGVNAISAFNQHMQESSAAEAKYYAENASRGKIASKLNQYGPDVAALLPEIVLAAISGGTTAVAGAGVKALNTVSKLDNMSDAMKIAGKWLKDNPTAALNFLQASGDAHKQALSEGATEQEALAYALLNGGMDGMITKYGVGGAKRGIESLPKNLRDGWKKVSNTVKSADAIAQEVAEGQIYGLMQRASRGVYDENAKLVSLRDENAVINPKAMIEDAALDAIAPAAMGGIDRRKGTPEPARVEVDKKVENNSRPDKQKNTGKKDAKGKQELEKDNFIQNLLNSDFSKIEDAPEYVLRDPKVQRFVKEESGVNISPLDKTRRGMIQKYKLASIEMKRKNP